MAGRFIDVEVEVKFAQKPGPPTSFLWEGREHKIVEILEHRRVLDFKRAWWQRRHRDWYKVRTAEGRIFELYFHRGPGRPYWVLLRELEAS
ncbi:MAG: DUF6504 family protein [Candidatus Bipolaricaulaceae bacterium]